MAASSLPLRQIGIEIIDILSTFDDRSTIQSTFLTVHLEVESARVTIS